MAVDAGNTHTVLGLFEGERLRVSWRVATRKESTADELGALLHVLFAAERIEFGAVRGIVISSVVPDVNDALRLTAERAFACPPLFVGPGLKTGMPILYENPHEVGADRIVNAVAAQVRFGAPVIVVDFGTATTFDVVSARGEYLGGVIAPGLGVSAEALSERAARLPRVAIRRPARVIGRHTEQSMQSGLFHGYVALVRGLVERIRAELGTSAPVVATGGLAETLAPELEFLEAVDLDLTLHGLRLVWERNTR